jgi:aspartate/methionine/tyrosine aminotransferase
MPPKLAPIAQSLGQSAVVAFRRIADDLEARGVEIVDLGIGEPDAHSPEPVIEALVRALRDGHDKYVDPRGLLALRECIAQFEGQRHGLRCAVDDIVVTTGSVGALSLATRALFGPGDEVLLPEPCYGPYRNQVRLTGATAKGVAMPIVDGQVRLDSDALRAAIGEQTKGIIVNTPWNPTGRVLSAMELESLGALAVEKNLWVIADEVYSELTYEPHHHLSFATLDPDIAARTITVNSVSKAFAMTGWRLGYCIAPTSAADVLSTINHLTTRCATSFAQHGAIAAYEHCLDHIDRQCTSYRQRRDTMAEALSGLNGVHCPLPEGTFYAFARFPDKWGDSRALARALLESEGVVVTPGSAYGASTRQYLRMSFAASESQIREGVARMQSFFETNG